ncbi:MAG: GntR family transcriptional regulator [Planctomycetota bacterium]
MKYLRQNLRDTWMIGDQLPAELDIAEHLGIARGTVRAALKELESQGLLSAGRGTGRVVCATPDAEPADPPVSPAAGQVLRETVVFARIPCPPVANNGMLVERAIFDAFAERGNPVLTVHLPSADDVSIQRLIDGRPVGVIAPHAVVSDAICWEMLQKIEAAGVPVVVQGDGEKLSNFSRVISDHRAGIQLLVNFLIERGVKRPVQIRTHGLSNDLPYWGAARYDGFLEDASKLDPRVINDQHDTFAGGEDARDADTFNHRVRLMAGLLVEQLTGPEPADALLFDTDHLCLYAAAAVRRFGLVPNRDVLIVGYDNYWSTSPLRRYEPAVVDATIEKDETAAGRALADLLLERISDFGDRKLHVRPPHLVTSPIAATPAFHQTT